MIYTIRKGKHRSNKLRFSLYWKKEIIAFRVVFDSSAKYFIPGEDQFDINKLFGVGYLPTHHTESARFGWRYNENTNLIELFAYCYINGRRVADLITTVQIDRSIILTIRISDDSYRFTARKNGIDYDYKIFRGSDKKIGYPLNVFFGGNKPAPKTINIEMKRL